LLLKAVDECSYPLLVAPEGALEGADFLVNQAFQFAGTGDRMLDAADQLRHLASHRLAYGGEAFRGHAFRPDQPQRGMDQGLGDVAHLLRPPEEMGDGPDQEDGQQEKYDDSGELRCAEDREHAPRALEDTDLGAVEAPEIGPAGNDPDDRDGRRHQVRRGRWPALQIADDGGHRRLVLVGRALDRRRLTPWRRRSLSLSLRLWLLDRRALWLFALVPRCARRCLVAAFA